MYTIFPYSLLTPNKCGIYRFRVLGLDLELMGGFESCGCRGLQFSIWEADLERSEAMVNWMQAQATKVYALWCRAEACKCGLTQTAATLLT